MMPAAAFDLELVLSAMRELYPDVRFGKVVMHWLNDEELLEINKAHLDHDYYTDIITFDYSRGSKVSGELFISLDRIEENARDLNCSVNQEKHRVVAHGILHLIGYGDKTPEEQEIMRTKEDEVLKAIGL
ncbi:MAG: rRNA maturation RNase YbeY [Flavobacteriaceae bacterium]